jgi:hypothetical protein
VVSQSWLMIELLPNAAPCVSDTLSVATRSDNAATLLSPRTEGGCAAPQSEC